MWSKFLKITIPFLAILVLLAGANVHPGFAQLINQWSSPRPIPDYAGSRPPLMVADQNKTVHLFYSEPLDNATDIYLYRQWTLDQGWTQPVDFLLNLKSVNSPIQSVYLDSSGIFHLVYFGDLQDDGNIYYMYVPALEAGRATSWSRPVLIGPAAGPVVGATIIGDGKGNLVVLYSGQLQGVGLYALYSTNNGLDWSDPVVITLIDKNETWPYSPKIALDENGDYHAVWSLVNGVGIGTGVFYARLSADLVNWTTPYALAIQDPGDYSTTWPSIIIDKNLMIVVYQDSFPAAKFMRLSTDGGLTWTDPIRPFPHIGEYENPVMVQDGNGVIHMLLGNRVGNPATHGMWHTTWLGQGWAELQPIVSGSRTDKFDPSAPQAVISQGNVLLVAWWNNVVEAEPSMYSYTVLNASELPVRPFPTDSPQVIPTVEPSATPVVSNRVSTAIPTFSSQGDAQRTQKTPNPAVPIFVGILPVIVFAVGIVIYQRYRNTNR